MARALLLLFLCFPTTLTHASPHREGAFIRGDADGNGRVDTTDAIHLFKYLFRGKEVRCVEALDANEHDSIPKVNMTDGVYLLSFLFVGGPPPAAPFPLCGHASNYAFGCDDHGFCGTEGPSVQPKKELFITDLSVVEDPCRTRDDAECDESVRGAWTFGKLMASMAGLASVDEDPRAVSAFVLGWLKQMENDQHVNGFLVKGRPGVRDFTNNWARASGFRSAEDPNLVLDMSQAPFRLLAIVSRLDLRQKDTDGQTIHAGEGRFIFSFLSSSFSLGGTVIFEYALPARDCGDVILWAKRWHELGSLPFGDEYNAMLQNITDDFAGLGADPRQPNGNSISQVRTNQVGISGVWELREFKLENRTRLPASSFSGSNRAILIQRPVAQTPDISYDGTKMLTRYLDSFPDDQDVPLKFEGIPFRGGSSIVPRLSFTFQSPNTDCTDRRQTFSLNTCSGCHSGDTRTPFTHVTLRRAGQESQLSRFLTGVSVSDRTCRSTSRKERSFNDLERRELDLLDLLEASCGDGGGSAFTDGPVDIFSTAHRARRVH